jgi:4-carboxymuconolactone decarboxylase
MVLQSAITINCREENVMSELTSRERELVTLGAAMGSNCVPCVEYHIRESQRTGLTDVEISAAIELADKVRQVPARKVREAAQKLLPKTSGCTEESGNDGSCETQPPGGMMSQMSQMMGVCCDSDQPAKAASPSEEESPSCSSTSAENKCC